VSPGIIGDEQRVQLPQAQHVLVDDRDSSILRLGGNGDRVVHASLVGPPVSVSGYSKRFRARRIRPNALKSRTVEPNWAVTLSWMATWPPDWSREAFWQANRAAAALRIASDAS
jgi:hypothetical protein